MKSGECGAEIDQASEGKFLFDATRSGSRERQTHGEMLAAGGGLDEVGRCGVALHPLDEGDSILAAEVRVLTGTLDVPSPCGRIPRAAHAVLSDETGSGQLFKQEIDPLTIWAHEQD